MQQPEFIAIVEETVLPALSSHGFRRVETPRGWIAPEVLCESNNRWFGASWDSRDGYLDATLGRLFLFRDVLPRVIVRGPLSVAETKVEEQSDEFCRRLLRQVASRLPEHLERFDELYPASIAMSDSTGSSNRKGRKVAREFLKFLGPEVTLEQWQRLAKADGTG